MKPIRFECVETLPLASREIAAQILDLSKWPNFQGYGPIPGIRSAEWELQTPLVVGSRIRVTNRDGSTHIEEIVEWEPDVRCRLRMTEFSPPLSRLATSFDETWDLRPVDGGTRVVRTFEIHARCVLARPLLRAIAFLLKRAIARSLRQMKADASPSNASQTHSG